MMVWGSAEPYVWDPSYYGWGLPQRSRVGGAAASEETLEDESAKYDALAAEWVNIRDEVFFIADEIGIGTEVRTIYFDTMTGLRAGQTAGAILSGMGLNLPAALAGGVGTSGAVAMGMSMGTLVGAAVAIISLLASDDDDAAKRAKHHAEFFQWQLSRMAKRMSLDDFIAEQDEFVSLLPSYAVLQPKNGVLLIAAGHRAQATAELYRRIQTSPNLSPLDLEIFVSVNNLTRWARFKKQIADVLATPFAPQAQKMGVGQAQANIDALIVKESDYLQNVLGAQAKKAGKLQPSDSDAGSNTAAALFWGVGITLALGGAYAFYNPAHALVLYRQALALGTKGYRVAKSYGASAVQGARSLVR